MNQKKNRSWVRKLKVKTNSKITDPKIILAKLESFYSDLYSNCNNTTDQVRIHYFILKTSVPVLSEESSILCDSQLTFNKCYTAVKDFDNNKSPGSENVRNSKNNVQSFSYSH